MSSRAVAAPDQIKVGLGRSNAVVTLAMLVFLGLIVGYATYGGVTTDDSSARFISFGLAGLFAIPLAMLLFALPRFLSPRYVVFDATGLHIQHGREQVTVPWPDVVALGIGYEQAEAERPRTPTSVEGLKELITGYLTNRVSEPLQVSDKRRIALEIYPVRPDAVHQFPKLAQYWIALPPPVEGVPVGEGERQRAGGRGIPSVGWRFPLPPVVSIAEEIDRGAHAFQPDRRLGWYPRPWSG